MLVRSFNIWSCIISKSVQSVNHFISNTEFHCQFRRTSSTVCQNVNNTLNVVQDTRNTIHILRGSSEFTVREALWINTVILLDDSLSILHLRICLILTFECFDRRLSISKLLHEVVVVCLALCELLACSTQFLHHGFNFLRIGE